MRFIFYVFIFATLFSCKAKQTLKDVKAADLIQLSSSQKVVFLDSTTAAKIILEDDIDHFFEKITIVDMAIQTKKAYPETISRKEVLKDYKAYLQKDVSYFTKQEKDFVSDVFREAYELSKQISPAIFPPEIQLIKTNGTHYGNSVYYTRENCIIIPQDVLTKPNHNNFLDVMLHEVFHIYSRYHPEKRAALYALIGFEDIGDTNDLVISEKLAKRILLNPDGIDFAQKIDLNIKNGQTISAIPIVSSNQDNFTPYQPSFFNYLDFQLYQIEQMDNGNYEVITKSDGSSSLNLTDLPDFFRQIRDNTQYIIHPDEILADNFQILVISKKKPTILDKLSKSGKTLIELVEEVLE